MIATLLGETEKAYKLRLARPDGKSMDFWVPKSKVVREDDSFTISGWKVKEAALDKFLAGDVQLTAEGDRVTTEELPEQGGRR